MYTLINELHNDIHTPMNINDSVIDDDIYVPDLIMNYMPLKCQSLFL